MKNEIPNLSKVELKTIKKLTKRKDISVTSADKGGAALTVDIEKYRDTF